MANMVSMDPKGTSEPLSKLIVEMLKNDIQILKLFVLIDE